MFFSLIILFFGFCFLSRSPGKAEAIEVIQGSSVNVFCRLAGATKSFFNTDGRVFDDDVVDGHLRIAEVGPQHNGAIYCSKHADRREPVFARNITVVGE